MPNRVTLLFHDDRWKQYRDDARQAARAALKAEKVANATVTLVLSDDAEVQQLNHDYRGKNKPTNVLSFADGSEEEGRVNLGDVVLAFETMKREAKEQGKTMPRHTAHLVVHGVLHLLGHDHEQDDEAETMEAREVAILHGLGIANPYRQR